MRNGTFGKQNNAVTNATSEPGRIRVSQAFACSLLNLTPLELERGGAAGAGVSSDAERGGAGVSRRGTVEIKGKGQMTTYWLEGM